MPQLNWKIDVGHLLTIALILAGGLIAYGRLSSDLSYLKEQVSGIPALTERVVRTETLVQSHVDADKVLRPSDVR